MESIGPLMNVREVAHLVNASVERTYQLCANGTIPAVRIGRRVRVPREAFERLTTKHSLASARRSAVYPRPSFSEADIERLARALAASLAAAWRRRQKSLGA